jgi:hypothetical protein
MGTAQSLKETRKQLRNIVREILPEVLTAELVGAVELKLQKKLDEIDSRHKDIASLMIRNMVGAKK